MLRLKTPGRSDTRSLISPLIDELCAGTSTADTWKPEGRRQLPHPGQLSYGRGHFAVTGVHGKGGQPRAELGAAASAISHQIMRLLLPRWLRITPSFSSISS